MRTRFAPSPTGPLHIGGLRTALFAWLVAKKTGSNFTLRIEDTDQAREVAGSTEGILRTLTSAGIAPDEGVLFNSEGNVTEKGEYGPYFQSKRLSLYKEHVELLLKNNHAYHCFCTPDRLDAMRKRQQELRQAPMYDRACATLSKEEIEKKITSGEKYVIRMKVPHEDVVTYTDAIYGSLSFKGHTIDDQILMKSDGFPTYHLAHVVDDHFMKMDLIIRGEEWLSSLPKHLILFKMFGWEAPKYAHVPLLLNKDRTKLSKRQNDVAAEDYLLKGYLPEALLNFLVLLGWNPGTEQELFSLEELINVFTLERVHKSGAIFDLEKLEWIQGQWMRKIPIENFSARILPLVSSVYPGAKNDPLFTKRAALIQERITFFSEAPDMMGYFYEPAQISMDIIVNPKQKIVKEDLPKILDFLARTLQTIDSNSWNQESIMVALEPTITASGFKKGQILWPLRAILTGREYSPGAYEVASLLTKEQVLKQIEKAQAH